MTIGRTADNIIQIKTNGELGLRAVECSCCGGAQDFCTDVGPEYNIISEDMYNALRYASVANSSGSANEYTGCSFSGTSSALNIGYLGCSFSVLVSGGTTCSDEYQAWNSAIGFSWVVGRVGSEFRFAYSGYGACYSNIYPPNCYTVGFMIGWAYDNFGAGPFTNVGTVTLSTSVGVMNFGIYNLDFTAGASLTIGLA